MKRERFDELMSDKSIRKMDGSGAILGIYERDSIVIDFIFSHTGFPNRSSSTKKRIMLSSFPLSDLNSEIPRPFNIDSKTLVLVNCFEPDYAILYSLNIDSDNRKVKANILEMPDMGESLLEESEKSGLEIGY